ncbi:acyl-CoA thioesterase [Chloroflexi bacterium TSY]|nr:acyl-CoA thioesterase [Chloroflexi bacterium TSY]
MAPKLTQAKVTTDISVRFAETDQMGVVHHASYIIWFEVGCVAWMEAIGVPYIEISRSGHNFAVTGIQASYRASATFGDKLSIVTSMVELRSRYIKFAYEIQHSETNASLVSGHSEHIYVDKTGKVTRMPNEILMRIQEGSERYHDSH